MATYNRAAKLAVVLDAYLLLDAPNGGWELFVVDNGSTDETRQVVDSYRRRLPLTYLFEPQRGKNAALNLALSEMTGDLVVMTDDDAVPRQDWLVQLRMAADTQPEFSIFGGVVLPKWEVPPADWILSWVSLAPTYSVTPPRLKGGPMTYDYVFGPNMAVRANIFKAGYRFDTTIGPRGKEYAMGSETELVLRLTQAGYRAWHCENAVVEHLIDKSQMTEEWLMRRAVRFGRGQTRLEDNLPSEPLRKWLGVPRYLVRIIGTQAFRLALATLKRNARARFQARWELNFTMGAAMEARRMHQAKKPRATVLLRNTS
jgi:glycosyltransferase involved in cell wall biosynthesis